MCAVSVCVYSSAGQYRLSGSSVSLGFGYRTIGVVAFYHWYRVGVNILYSAAEQCSIMFPYDCLMIDDTDKQRSKSVQDIASLHKLHDKDSGGYILDQNLVFLLQEGTTYHERERPLCQLPDDQYVAQRVPVGLG